jgi:hypothetical protein
MVEVSSIGKTEEERDIMLVKVFGTETGKFSAIMGVEKDEKSLKIGGSR